MSTGRAVGHVGHVFDRRDLGDHALVAVAAGHLVARLQAALDGQVDLDHLQHAGRQLVALRQLLALLFESEVEAVAGLLERVLDAPSCAATSSSAGRMSNQWYFSTCREVGLVDDRALGDALRAAIGHLADQQLLDTVEGVGLDDAQLVVQVEAEALELVVDDLLGALVALDAFAGEHLHVDHRALVPWSTRSEVSFTSDAFSPKMARSSFSSGVSVVSPLGVTLPTSTSPGATSAPM
jgi:hypothetical protein